jgi:DNA-binding NarL/FixJ family response regulator
MARALERPLELYVVALDGVTAGVVVRALDREGLSVSAAWGSELQPPEGRRAPDLVVVVEPAGEVHPDAAYARIRTALPEAAIVVLCSPGRPRPQGLVWSGVDGILIEPAIDSMVGPAVQAALAGYLVMPRELRAALQPPKLSARERQLVALVAKGLTNREIAERLYLAESTVKHHLSATFRRLGVRSRHEAAAALLGAERTAGAEDTAEAERPVDEEGRSSPES